ncbi:MAG: hypothetical protein ACTSO3_01265 [Candidatus Heimdallarchaeaceae archaeon]
MNNIIACGVPRTGSTLIWQILIRALPNRKVIKAHPASWEPIDNCFIVGSIRHPYDNAASCFRSRVIGDDGDGVDVKGTKKGLIAELRMLKNNYDQLRILLDKYPSFNLRYENFFNNFDYVFDIIESDLKIKVPYELRKEIKIDCSFGMNMKRSFANIKGQEYQKTKINPGHVGVGIPGSWKAIIPRWGYDVMRKWCDPLCKDWGYEGK